MVFHLRQRQVLVDVLAHIKRRQNVERQLGDDAEAAEAHGCPAKLLAVPFARQMDDVAGAGDDLHRRDGRREAAVAVARAVCPRRAGTGDGDMRERGHIVQREAGPMQFSGEVLIPDAAGNRHGAARGVDRHRRLEPVERDKVLGRVGDIGERVARADHLQLAVPGDQVLNLGDRFGIVQAGGTEGGISGPVVRKVNHGVSC